MQVGPPCAGPDVRPRARRRDPNDRRKTLAQLTDRGTATAWSAGHDEFAAMLFADLKTPELAAFVPGLERVLARLADAVPTRPADTGYRVRDRR